VVRGLDSGNIGIDEDDVQAFFPQRLDGLAARIIELARFADLERAAAEEEDFFQPAPGFGDIGRIRRNSVL
jgi:hypothetical protein